MQSSESNPPVKTRSTESVQEPKKEAFPEELMRLARPPKGITVEIKDGVLTIRRRWWVWSPVIVMFLAMTVVMNASIFFAWGATLWFRVANPEQAVNEQTVGLFCSTAGFLVCVNYFMALVALNASTLTVNAHHLAVTSGPLEPSADFDALTRSIEQIFITERGSVWSEPRPIPYSKRLGRFNVVARLHSGENQVLLCVHRVEQAKFIEHRLEAFLGIVNEPVDGEVEG